MKNEEKKNPLDNNLSIPEKIAYLEKEHEEDIKELLRLNEENNKLKCANEEMKETNENLKKHWDGIQNGIKSAKPDIGVNIVRIQDKLNECKYMLFPLRGILALFMFYFGDKEQVRGGDTFPEEHYIALRELSRKSIEMMDTIQNRIATIANDSLQEIKQNVQE